MMKQLFTWMRNITKHKQIINIAVFALCLFLGGLLNLLSKDQAVSEQENRALAQMPQFQRETFLNGEYFTEIENYFADQFFSRDFFAGISNDVQSLMGFPGAHEVQLVASDGFNVFEEHIAVDPVESALTAPMDTDAVISDNSAETVATQPGTGVPRNPAGSSSTGAGTAAPNNTVELSPAGANATVPNNSTGSSSTGPDATTPDNPNGSSSTGPDATTPDSPNGSSPAGTDTTAPNNPAGSSSTGSDANPVESSPAKPDLAPSPTSKPARDDEGKTIGKVLIYKDAAYALFPFSQDSANYYVKTLNQFHQQAGEGVKVYSMLAPTSMEFLKEEKFQELTDSQKDTIEYVNARLKGVVPVDAYTPILEHSDEYVYFRTDHHWTALGAYYAYTGFTQAAGLEPVSLDKYQTDVIEGYIGSMYETTGSSNLKRNPDSITVYKPFTENEYNIYYGSAIKMKVIDMSHADKKIKYRVFLSGDRPLGIIKTDVANGKKILVIKDSYGNAMVPFLLPHYEEIYIVDPRQYEKNIFSLVQNNDIQEVLFLNYVPILSYYGYIDLIVKVMEAEVK
ncbi:MAG: hypothetical protein GX115_14005 [Ruminiclostridium sp.]|nr:hypothetical protein [Ruminiclostridium sp.]